MKKIAFCGGGSAGHVMPNIAVYENLKDKYDVSYIGCNGIEKNICGHFGLRFLGYDGVKFVRGKIITNLAIPYKLLKSRAQCVKILEREKPDLLFCKGGYVSLPPAFAAFKLGIPVITHESDITAGLANKLIARRCEKVLTSFPTTAEKFYNGVYTGSPMRDNLFNADRQSARAKFNLDDRPTVLVFGGGSGSKIINDCLRKCLFELCTKYNVLHLCGRGNAVESNVYGYKQVEFCNDMGAAYACADYAVARCGSNSAFELIALKIPTLFIPLQNKRSRGDQVKNAEHFNSLGLCHVLAERDLTPQNLTDSLNALFADKQLKTALEMCGIECGNKKIVNEIDKILS